MLKCYGSLGTSLCRALEKVGNLLLPEDTCTAVFSWEDDPLTQSHVLLSIKELISSRPENHKILLFQLMLPARNGPAASGNFRQLHAPFPLTQLLRAIPQDKETALTSLNQAINSQRRVLHASNLGFDAHSSAAKNLWPATELTTKANVLQACALIVDDHVTNPPFQDSAYARAASKLLGLGFEVYLSPRFQDAVQMEGSSGASLETPAVYLASANDSGHVHLNPTFRLRVYDIDLVLLDIAEEKEPRKAYILSGLGRDLTVLNGLRICLPSPQIYMLSHLPRELMAHLCSARGADYYLEKEEFLRDHPFKITRLLAHTIGTIRGQDASRIEQEWLPPPGGDDWQRFLGDARDSEMSVEGRDEFRKVARTLAYHLYGQRYDVRSVRYQSRAKGGLSGAHTLIVRPEDFRGLQRPRVMKIANKFEVSRELNAYKRFIEPYVSAGFARVEANWVAWGELGAISYEFAGMDYGGQDVTDFSRRFNGMPWAQARNWLTTLLDRMDILHSKVVRNGKARAEKPVFDIWRYFCLELANHLVDSWPCGAGGEDLEILKVRTDGDDSYAVVGYCHDKPFPLGVAAVNELRTWRVASIESLGPAWLVRPGKRFSSQVPHSEEVFLPCSSALAQVAQSAAGHERRRWVALQYIEKGKSAFSTGIHGLALVSRNSDQTTPWGMVHGDLHLENFLIPKTGDGDSLWIIDYGKTRLGPPAIDYIVLEYAFRRIAFDILGQALDGETSAEKWLEQVRGAALAAEEYLCDPHSRVFKGWKFLSNKKATAKLRKALSSIKFIRQEARRRICGGTLDTHYQLVSFLFMVRAAQLYREEAKAWYGPVGTLWAYDTARSLMQQLENITGNP